MKYIFIFLLLLSTKIYAEESLFNKSKSFFTSIVKKFDNYDNCLLENIGDDATSRVISEKKKLCLKKFKTKLVEEQKSLIDGRGRLDEYNYFSADIYNGSDSTIYELVITIKYEDQEDLVDRKYTLSCYEIFSLASGECKSKSRIYGNKIKFISWNILDVYTVN